MNRFKRSGLAFVCVAAAFSSAGCNAGDANETTQTIQHLTQSGVEGELVVNNDWGSGYCANVTLDNQSSSEVSGWTVILDMDGTSLGSAWSGDFSQSGNTGTVTPAAYNRFIAPGGSVSFGFCGNGDGTPFVSALEIQGGGSSDGGSTDDGSTDDGSTDGGSDDGSTDDGGSSSDQCAEARENTAVTLSCSGNEVVSAIAFASYGTPGGSCGGYSASSCNASNSRSIVEGACLGQSGCTVDASNGVFGDPCSGTRKRLFVEYTCGPDDGSTGGSDDGGGSDGGGTDDGGTDEGGEMLPLDGNPVIRWFDDARTEWSSGDADIILSYQQDNGGWPKNLDYDSMGNGGNDRGTFDNGATVTEVVYLAERYRATGQSKYRDAVRRAADFILEAQYSTGAWPQFYPLRDGYWDYATFNDDAMAHVLTVLDRAVAQAAPFDTDVFSSSDRADFQAAIDAGVDYILRAQYRQNGQLSVWCAQHGPFDYEPKPARAYELESLSGKESIGVLAFLMTQPQTNAVETAVRAGIDWFRNSVLEGYVYVKSNDDPVTPRSGGRMWYRFYKLDTNRGFFSDRDGGTYYDIMDISEERRTGYTWGGNWGDKIIGFAEDVGY